MDGRTNNVFMGVRYYIYNEGSVLDWGEKQIKDMLGYVFCQGQTYVHTAQALFQIMKVTSSKHPRTFEGHQKRCWNQNMAGIA